MRTYVNQSAAGLKATITPAFSTLESLTFLIGRLSAHYGKQRVRELVDIACENKEEAQRVEAALKTHLDKLLQELEVQELEEKVGRR